MALDDNLPFNQLAPEDIKVINASFSTLYVNVMFPRNGELNFKPIYPCLLCRITSLMISRLVLNLRDAAEEYRYPATNRASHYVGGSTASTRAVELTWH